MELIGHERERLDLGRRQTRRARCLCTRLDRLIIAYSPGIHPCALAPCRTTASFTTAAKLKSSSLVVVAVAELERRAPGKRERRWRATPGGGMVC